MILPSIWHAWSLNTSVIYGRGVCWRWHHKKKKNWTNIDIKGIKPSIEACTLLKRTDWDITGKLREQVLPTLTGSKVLSDQVLCNIGDILDKLFIFLSFQSNVWWIMHMWNANTDSTHFEILKDIKCTENILGKTCIEFQKPTHLKQSLWCPPKHKHQWVLTFLTSASNVRILPSI